VNVARWLLPSLVLIAAAALGSRGAPPSPGPRAVPPSAPRPVRGRPKTAAELPTTSAEIFLSNLDGQIVELERLAHEQPANTVVVKRLAGALYQRGRYRGDPHEIARALDVASVCVRAAPGDASCLLLRAEASQSLHRFAAARADVTRAASLGAEPARVRALEADLDWNDGLYERAIPAIREARRRAPSTATWLREAQLEHELGDEAAADRAFEAAEDTIVDTSPLVVAHLDVQRGIQKVDVGELDAACVFFREAVARTPDGVAANEHLAEALRLLGKNDEAARIYERVTALSEDPEFLHALAELRAISGDTEAARALGVRARDGYERLLRELPEAMYWHASEHYLATGDTSRAHELLQKNVVLRPNATSFVALARAELALGDVPAAKANVARALEMPLVSAALYATASRVYAAEGDEARAEVYRARALRVSPLAFGPGAGDVTLPEGGPRAAARR